jgi:hypothetical protein
MDLVSPPFLLDFAGVRFSDPEFSADTLVDIHATIDERFGTNAHIAYAVYNSLLKLGMYYLDLRPSNLNIEGLPDTLAPNNDSDEWT